MIEFVLRSGGGTTSKGAAQIVCGTDGSRLLSSAGTPSATACTPCFTSTTPFLSSTIISAVGRAGHRVLVFR
ncbi:MAG: hypothetical protein KatS3mg059_1758 [Thermomicrobiales bacterium]|nr:MAG: hypothetical protein KatS3mg059_1758 [Thermomicrobiales bacterium]